ncbi:ABC transporter ATP-binding protein [Humisphaera borealis]|uniref:ABC transporter ATP-binding protein n=1 Tax=Humisphaera borealis TaxID=2807512 RepID=A0A7M2WS57_9BACT|nr:ABC transporter ATP-binding protein [Humisphaera borealis]QOV88239.1 ABC transporter ATP-binding protein [Humisphaera borealis]
MALRLELLKKQYVGPDGSAVPVIDVPEFSLGDSEQVALVGGSGTGKTTLLHLIAGILTPDSGRIIFSGTGDGEANVGESDIAALSEGQRDVFRGRNLGYIFQSHHLLPGFTALENVLLGMSFTHRAADPAWAKSLLKEVGLGERLHYKPAKLSVGQQQRVAVARALANRPKLVLADEPTGALDPKTAQQVLALVRKLCDEVKASLLLVSHDPAIVEQLPRRVSLAELNRASMV